MKVGIFNVEKKEDGTFLYKADLSNLIDKTKKKNISYKEKPQYPLIEEYEKKSLERYRKDLINMDKNIITYLNQIK